MSAETVIRILKAREERAARHKMLREIYPGTLLAFTMNIPGENKSAPEALRAFEAGLKCINILFSSRRVNVLKHESSVTDDGPQACWIIDTPPLKLKEWMMEIEQGHKLGRLFDLDVQDAEGKTLHREHLGYELRKCLLCDNPAHACGRSRAHSLCELQEAIQEMVCEYVEGEQI